MTNTVLAGLQSKFRTLQKMMLLFGESSQFQLLKHYDDAGKNCKNIITTPYQVISSPWESLKAKHGNVLASI